MAEQIDLTTPVTKPPRTSWKLRHFNVDAEEKLVTVILVSNNQDKFLADYPTPPVVAGRPSGQQVFTTLNNANNGTVSMIKRLYNRLLIDFPELAGTVTGTPD